MPKGIPKQNGPSDAPTHFWNIGVYRGQPGDIVDTMAVQYTNLEVF